MGGAAAIGFAPVLVRLSMTEVGPSATGFFRLLLALPVVWVWLLLEGRAQGAGQGAGSERWPRGKWALLMACGAFFAGDMAFWHWSLQLTTVANSTLLTNFAPLFVIVGGWLFFAERVTPGLLLGLGLALAGGGLLMEGSWRFSQARLVGDLLGLVTAFFYAGYLLTVKALRRYYSTARILAWSGLVSCPLLGLAALLAGETIQPVTLQVWFCLAALALVSHVTGQGLIASALADLPAGFSSIGLLAQALVAALLAWMLLAEGLSPGQLAGGLVILAGIALASRSPGAHSSTSISSGSGAQKKVFPRAPMD
jgi:drug/metabolite transporter (DMT)-like permease